ncbi:MAG TPA: flagellar cap protein FliD N-terminal domain-containing protein, partial [Agromyces sp.]
MGISLDGLASGLDTTTLIATLMQVEARPQQLLKISQARTTTQVTDLQTLNARLASLLEKATTAAKPAGLQHFTTTSSDASVTVTAKSGAAEASTDVRVLGEPVELEPSTLRLSFADPAATASTLRVS